MAETGQKISALQAATSAADADVLAGVQNTATKKFSFSVILNYIKSKLLPADIGAVPNTRTVNSKALSADIALTAADVGAATSADIPAAYATNPEMDGAASAGSSTAWARGDHVHPADTSKADVDGSYRELTAGQILSDGRYEDKVPYLFRKSGGEYDVGNDERDTLVGGTVAWNQLVQNGNFADGTNGFAPGAGTLSVSNGVCAYTVTSVSNNTYANTLRSDAFDPQVGHKYLISAFVTLPHKPTASRFNLYVGGVYSYFTPDANKKTFCQSVVSATSTAKAQIHFAAYSDDGWEVGDVAYAEKFSCFDLTLMFGSAIANYIYTLEQTTKGAGVAWFRALFPKDYYAYNTGELLSVKASAHKTVGFNAYDNTTGTAKLLGGHQYQITGAYTALAYTNINGDSETITPDADGIFSPAYTGTLTVTGGNGTTTCVHLVRNGYRNGEFEPFIQHTYLLDSSLTLRGVPMWAGGKMYYDGDTYEADGTVTRRFGERAYESGDESLPDAVTDGTTTVYKLATPTTESADPFTSPQTVDTWGTEEYVVTEQSGVAVPVGHDTFYDKDLRGKLEAMPDSVPSTASIAPTENGDTASQAYAAGRYFFRNGDFCKALTSIAAGASFTLNTNYAVTTIAAELYTALH